MADAQTPGKNTKVQDGESSFIILTLSLSLSFFPYCLSICGGLFNFMKKTCDLR